MKRFASFLMIVMLLFTITWSGATIPDMKENSKTEKVQKDISAKMVKVDLVKLNQNELMLVKFNYSDLDYVPRTKNIEYNLHANSSQLLSKSISAKNEKINYRSARDGFRWKI